MPTQAQVAALAGVSQETVSHILGSKADRYQESTRLRVLEAVRQLGYRPHRGAQLMRKGKSNLIGIIHFGTSNNLALETAVYLPQMIQSQGYDVFVVDLSWHGGCHRRAVELLVEARVEGVIISHMVESFGRDEVAILEQAGIPVVSLAGNEKLGIPTVFGDSGVAIQSITEHLLDLGHQSLLLLANEYESRPTLSRMAGFQTAIKQAGGRLVDGLDALVEASEETTLGMIQRLPADRGNFDQSLSAYHYTQRLIANRLLPDVVVCSNDHWARGVFSAALEAGLRIPDDLAVTGFDNESFAARAPYYLTTAAPDVAEESRKVVEILIELMAGRPAGAMQYVFPCKVIIRQSCGNSKVVRK